jgi:uncharacterized protein
MRIYAVADIHAKPGRLDIVRAGVAGHAPDVLVVAGDVSNYVNPHAVFRRLNDLGLPVMVVRGNTDLAWHERCCRRYARITCLHMRKVKIKGFPFVGISGTLPVPFGTRFRLFEKRLLERASRLVCPETILVVHPPPHGTLDRVLGRLNAGSRGLSGMISRCMPRVVLCGHIHEDPGIEKTGPTLVINCSIGAAGKGIIVDFDDDHPEIAPAARMA